MKGLDGGRINIATCSVGAAQGALAQAQRNTCKTANSLANPIASFQALQFKLADMATELVAARQMVRLAASKLDAGARDATTYCAMAKRFATDAGFTVINEALQLHGGYGYIREYPLGACCATPACTRFWKAPTKSCASSSPAACSMAMRRRRFLMPQRSPERSVFDSCLRLPIKR